MIRTLMSVLIRVGTTAPTRLVNQEEPDGGVVPAELLRPVRMLLRSVDTNDFELDT